MSLRAFFRKVEGFNKRRDHNKELQFQVAALQTAEVVNILGAANSKKGQWRHIGPDKFLDGWLGKSSDIEDRRERHRRMNKLHKERLAREKARKVKSPSA